MNITFKRIEESDREIINKYYKREQPKGCEQTFGNNLLWGQFFLTRYAIIEDSLVFLSAGEEVSVSFPLGSNDVKKAVETLFQFFAEKNAPFHMHMVTKEQFDKLEELFPGKFQIEYDRNVADYVYEREKLQTLAGSKLHAKRNHINKFIANYPDWSYEEIDDTNRLECLKMAEEWWKQNSQDNNLSEAIDILSAKEKGVSFEDFEKRAEFEVTKNALLRLEELDFRGGLIRIEGRVVAFSIGEAASEDTFVVHIEKAFSDVQGAYPIINREFVAHEATEYDYVNREEDAGVEGLRKAKLSYRPAFLLEKGSVTLKTES